MMGQQENKAGLARGTGLSLAWSCPKVGSLLFLEGGTNKMIVNTGLDPQGAGFKSKLCHLHAM